MRKERLLHSLRLLTFRRMRKRTAYLKKHEVLGAIGDNCVWGPWLVPLYPKLIKIHDNVRVHKTAKIVTHDVINGFLRDVKPDLDFGHVERLGCIEIMDNVYIAMNVTIMPNVRIGSNCIVTAGSVVTSDVPENSIVSGNPAKVIGKFDMYLALRCMSKNQHVAFKNQELPDSVAEKEWEKFYLKHSKDL